ncbi:hypothetical protein Trydic_g11090 [Trypoxylus dichotomus]
MFCEKAYALVKELNRNQDLLPPYNNDLLNEIGKEITTLITQNQSDAQANESHNSEGVSMIPTIRIKFASNDAMGICMLAKYMRSLGDDGGVNLCMDMRPPKALYIEVRCVVDYGRFELSDGTVLLLKKDSRHYLPRSECEELIRQGRLFMA